MATQTLTFNPFTQKLDITVSPYVNGTIPAADQVLFSNGVGIVGNANFYFNTPGEILYVPNIVGSSSINFPDGTFGNLAATGQLYLDWLSASDGTVLISQSGLVTGDVGNFYYDIGSQTLYVLNLNVSGSFIVPAFTISDLTITTSLTLDWFVSVGDVVLFVQAGVITGDTPFNYDAGSQILNTPNLSVATQLNAVNGNISDLVVTNSLYMDFASGAGSAVLYVNGGNIAVDSVFTYNDATDTLTIPIITANTKIGIGSAATAKLSITASSGGAGTAPIRLTASGASLLGAPELNAIEVLSDKIYYTITSGTARKEFTLNDGSLTSGRVPFAFTNGRLIDASTLVFNSGTGALSATILAATGLTTLGVVYSNSGTLSVNASQFAWDFTNLRLGVGTGSPAVKFDVLSTVGSTDTARFQGPSSGGNVTYAVLNVYNSNSQRVVALDGGNSYPSDFGSITMLGYGSTGGSLMGDFQFCDGNAAGDKRLCLIRCLRQGSNIADLEFYVKNTSFISQAIYIYRTGLVGFNINVPLGMLHAVARSSSTIGIISQAAASSSVNAYEMRTSDTTVRWLVNQRGEQTIQSVAIAGAASAPQLLVTAPAHTTITASSEVIDANFNLARTVQRATGAVTTNRAFLIQAPTYSFVGSSTITTASTFAIAGPPVAGTNATITETLSAWVQTGNVALGTPSSATSQLKFYHASSANATIIQAGNASGAVTYTLPTAAPAVTGYVLSCTTAGVMSWAAGGAGGGVSGAGTQYKIPVWDTTSSIADSALTSDSGNKTLIYAPTASTTGSPTIFKITGPAHTTLTASTEAIDLDYALNRTVQFSTGALTTQRAALFRAPTYGFVGASTLTNAATVAILAAPIAGTNATITNAYSLWVQAGNVRSDGNVVINAAAPNVALDVNGGVAWRATSPAQITGDVDDYAIGSGTFFRLDADSPTWTISGFTGGVDGKRLILANVGANVIYIANNSSSSAAANRVITGNAAPISLYTNERLDLIYDATDQKWRAGLKNAITAGSGNAGSLAYWTDSTTLSYAPILYFDGSGLGVGVDPDISTLHVKREFTGGGLQVGWLGVRNEMFVVSKDVGTLTGYYLNVTVDSTFEIDTAYGLYIEAFGGAGTYATARYGIYQNGPNEANFFAGTLTVNGNTDIGSGYTKTTTFRGIQKTIATTNSRTQQLIFTKDTTNATPTEMTRDGNAPSGTTNLLAIATDTTYSCMLNVCAQQSGASVSKQMLRQFVIRNDGGTTQLVGTVLTLGTDIADAGAATWAVTVTANNTDDALKIEVTGAAATNIRWTAVLTTSEVTYA